MDVELKEGLGACGCRAGLGWVGCCEDVGCCCCCCGGSWDWRPKSGCCACGGMGCWKYVAVLVACEVGEGNGAASPARCEVDIARSVLREKSERFELAFEAVVELFSEAVVRRFDFEVIDMSGESVLRLCV